MADNEKWIPVREAADRLSSSAPVLRQLIKRGELDAIRPTPRTTRISESSLKRLVERRVGRQGQ